MLHSFRLVVFFLYCSAFCIDSIWTIPILNERQDATTVTTVQILNTVEGPVTQTCVITFKPITDSSGNPAVQEVEDCKISPGTSASVPSSTPPPPPPSSSSSSSPSPTTSPQSTSPSVSTATPSSTPSSVANTSNVPPSPATGTGTSTATPSASEASSSSPTTKFQIPGKNLSVLPIGLGVFAGIVVIALIVVGLVTYERTKYRKAFRQRRLAEQGATMGYSGQV